MRRVKINVKRNRHLRPRTGRVLFQGKTRQYSERYKYKVDKYGKHKHD